MSAHSFQESEELNLDLKKQDLKQNGLSRKNYIAKQSSKKDSPKPLFMEILRKLILEQFKKSIYLQEDFPAKTSQMLERELESRGVVLHSGNITLKQLAHYDQNTHSLKMYQQSVQGDYLPFSVTLPQSGMMRNGIVYQLPQLARTTNAKGFSLLPTPNAFDWNVPENKKAWEKRAKYQKSKGVSLHLPLKSYVIHEATKKGKGETWQETGLLNPNWVEWLMGFPIGWTELNLSETQLFLKLQKFWRKQLKEKKKNAEETH